MRGISSSAIVGSKRRRRSRGGRDGALGQRTWVQHLQWDDQSELGLVEVELVKALTEFEHGVGHVHAVEDVHPSASALKSVRGNEVELPVLVQEARVFELQRARKPVSVRRCEARLP